MTLAITGATGKIGRATLNALVQQDLLPSQDIIVVTSSALDSDKVKALRSTFPRLKEVRHAAYGDTNAMQRALIGVDTLFLVSTPNIALDFNDAPSGKGREGEHISVIDAAIAAGVRHLIYTSLAFADPSKAGVMRAHFRTEAYLQKKANEGALRYTSLREGLYNESWPLYLGHYKVDGETRDEVVIAGDGPISFTSIADLGLASGSLAAAVAQGDKQYDNKIIPLSQRATLTLQDIAALAGVNVSMRSPTEYVAHYRDEAGMEQPFLEWWVSTYPSVAAGHTDLGIDSPLEALLKSKGHTPKSMKSTVQEMLAKT